LFLDLFIGMKSRRHIRVTQPWHHQRVKARIEVRLMIAAVVFAIVLALFLSAPMLHRTEK
jgi:hypothetical protein